jgi:polysaccharide chain length determinant protein (PEP-CTERM system associated)
MKESLAQILMQARGMWRFRWYALLAAWTIAVLGWAIIALLPNTYEVEARVWVDTDTLLKPLLHGLTVNTDPATRVEMVAHMIVARGHLEEVARATGLAARARTPAQYQQLIDNLSKEITISGSGSGNIYWMSYSDHDPATAANVVKQLLSAFIHDTLGMKRADSGNAQQFLQSRIREYDGRLEDAEHRLADFKRRNVGLLPGEGVDYFTQLQTESGKLQKLQAKLNLALDQKTELQRQLGGEEPTFGLFSSAVAESNASAGPIDSEIEADQEQIAKLELKYTDKYPSVVALKAQIEQLEKQKAAAPAVPKARSSALPVPTNPSQAAAYQLDLNPVYQDLKVQLSQTEVNIAELRGQIAEETQAVRDLKSRINTIPLVQAQLAQLTRNYTVTKTVYDSLLQRLDSAQLSEQAAAANGQVKFTILERPEIPLTPSSPNRSRLMTLALMLALAAGVGLAFLLNELHPVFLSRATLATVTGLPVLGSVSLVQSGVALPLLKRDSVRLGAGAAGLVVVYGLAVMLAEPVSRLAHLLIR